MNHSGRGLVVNLMLFMPEALGSIPGDPDIFSFIETFSLKTLATQDKKYLLIRLQNHLKKEPLSNLCSVNSRTSLQMEAAKNINWVGIG